MKLRWPKKKNFESVFISSRVKFLFHYLFLHLNLVKDSSLTILPKNTATVQLQRLWHSLFAISFKILSLDKFSLRSNNLLRKSMDLDYGTINETFSLRSNNLLHTEFMDLMILDYGTQYKRNEDRCLFRQRNIVRGVRMIKRLITV